MTKKLEPKNNAFCQGIEYFVLEKSVSFSWEAYHFPGPPPKLGKKLRPGLVEKQKALLLHEI